MEEIFPILLFVFWLLISGVGGKKKREEARQRADAERAAREARSRERMEAPRPRAPDPAGADATGTAMDMVPDELWAILTGGAPRPTGPQAPSRVPEPEPSYDDEPWQPAGPEEGGWVTSPPWDEDDAVHSIEGVSAETRGEDVVDYDDLADRHARARYENLRATTWDEKPTSRDAVAVRMSETSDRRHFEFHDTLRASEIGSVQASTRSSGLARLGLQNIGDVRRAIVLLEVLGPPKALQ